MCKFTLGDAERVSIKFPLKRKGCQVVVSVLIAFVRHLGTFVNASHTWYTVNSLQQTEKCNGVKQWRIQDLT